MLPTDRGGRGSSSHEFPGENVSLTIKQLENDQSQISSASASFHPPCEIHLERHETPFVPENPRSTKRFSLPRFWSPSQGLRGIISLRLLTENKCALAQWLPCAKRV
jgi:hypothetical protein